MVEVKFIEQKKTEIHIEEQRECQGTYDKPRTAYDKPRTAIVYLNEGFFDRCEYKMGDHKKYSYTDWEFIRVVADTILNNSKHK